MTWEQPQKDESDSSAALERLFKKWPRERDNISFEGALGLLDEVELALESARNNLDVHGISVISATSLLNVWTLALGNWG